MSLSSDIVQASSGKMAIGVVELTRNGPFDARRAQEVALDVKQI